MKSYFKFLLFVTLIYLSVFYLISLKYGLPPFNFGYTIGFPTMYYQFETRNDTHHGFMGLMSVFWNICIISVISYLTMVINKKLKKQ
ncbi:Hypothetical transmembrane protein [Flavobacterium indicum GPTSA100-9 = DSM 17447]|uniref:Hypothetical transmembrane protein n=1 Tax=Flavobacterium indicum (strain DSM 17447 / CIP 109464 / GPTSA100-9) TaxID=1094466 RepID=H8XSU0_FLAIG|nr:hypothetical protein [Flavobacterium indicum]CCG53482.1 Hypothetical transmembrane protein [Flavobacterium indicum GPTSA100-9 = DSM 17447]